MIYAKTPTGQAAFQARLAPLTGKFRTAFLLFDGIRDSAEVLASTAGLGFVPEDIVALINWGFVVPVDAVRSGQHTSLDDRIPDRPSDATAKGDVQTQAVQLATSLLALASPLTRLRLTLAVESIGNASDLRKLLPQIEDAVGKSAAQPLADLLAA